MDLSETLLLLVGAVAPDGGRGVAQSLRAILEEAVPFDAAEAVLRRPGGWAHSRLDDGDAAVAGDDLLSRLATLRAPLRIDELPEAASFPETERRMSVLGLHSLLAIPFAAGAPSGGADSGPEGAIVLARRFGWAFAGASLHYLWPVAGIAGRAFELAIALTALTERTERLEAEVARLAAAPEAHEAERAGLLQQLEDARSETHEVQAAAEALRAARAEAVSHALDLEGVLGEAANERDAFRDKLVPAMEALESERRDGREARSHLEAVLGRVAELEAALGEAHAQSASLRAELEHAHRETEALRARAAALASETEAARGQLESRGQEADLDRRALEAARAELEAVRGELAAARDERERARAEHAAHVRSLRQELEAAHAAATDKGAALVQAEERCRQLEARSSRRRV